MTRFFARMQSRRLEKMRPPSKMVAIVVPLSTRPGLNVDEQMSLRHLRHYLGKYDKFMVAPKFLAVDYPDFEVKRLDDSYFGSQRAHSWLQLSPDFYEAFLDYKYIFMYHLDSLAFSDQLKFWCDKDFDFIGAPWFPGQATPWVKEPTVGNSGFSLHKVRSFLRVIYSPRLMMEPSLVWEHFQRTGSLVSLLRMFRRCLFFRNNIRWDMETWMRPSDANCDMFFAARAKLYLPEFQVATPEEALQFAFETDPRGCFRKNSGRLPFGCHAWGRYDRAFWEPYLLRKADESELSLDLPREEFKSHEPRRVITNYSTPQKLDRG